jgi:hypothetical protein
MSTDTKALLERLRLPPDEKSKGAMQRDGLTAAEELERLTTELANERANGVHTCNPGCTLSGCVNRGLRAELAIAQEAANDYGEITSILRHHDACKELRGPFTEMLKSALDELAALRERLEAATPVVTECRDALAEELGAWDIDPPLHHVKQAHERCESWLAAMSASTKEPKL